MRVLISAYACEPNKGSEPGVGWNWVIQISGFAETWVMTRSNNRPVIERELKKYSRNNLHFIYMDLPAWLRFWKRGPKGMRLYYILWQLLAFKIAKKLSRQYHFDFCHHLTFGNIWMPIFISFLPIPFVWGPLGGGEQVAKSFRNGYSIKAKIREIVRDLLQLTLRYNLLFLHNCKKAKVIVAKTESTADKIPPRYREKAIVATDVAVLPECLGRFRNNVRNSAVQVVCVGNLEHWRGFDLAIKAFSRAVQDYDKMNLVIIGDGDDKSRLAQICKAENVADKITFLGRVSHKEVHECMNKSSIFLNPCLKEGGVTVLFDAILAGLPVICLDIAGATEVVQQENGIKIKPINPEQTIKDLTAAILKLASDADLREKMGEAGRRRIIIDYNWDKKGELIQKIYQLVFNK